YQGHPGGRELADAGHARGWLRRRVRRSGMVATQALLELSPISAPRLDAIALHHATRLRRHEPDQVRLVRADGTGPQPLPTAIRVQGAKLAREGLGLPLLLGVRAVGGLWPVQRPGRLDGGPDAGDGTGAPLPARRVDHRLAQDVRARARPGAAHDAV